MAGDRALPGSSGTWQWLQGGTGGTHAWQWPPDHWEMLQGCFSHHQHRHLSLPGQLGDTQDSLRSWGWCLWKVLVALPWGQGSREQKDMSGAPVPISSTCCCLLSPGWEGSAAPTCTMSQEGRRDIFKD